MFQALRSTLGRHVPMKGGTSFPSPQRASNSGNLAKAQPSNPSALPSNVLPRRAAASQPHTPFSQTASSTPQKTSPLA